MECVACGSENTTLYLGEMNSSACAGRGEPVIASYSKICFEVMIIIINFYFNVRGIESFILSFHIVKHNFQNNLLISFNKSTRDLYNIMYVYNTEYHTYSYYIPCNSLWTFYICLCFMYWSFLICLRVLQPSYTFTKVSPRDDYKMLNQCVIVRHSEQMLSMLYVNHVHTSTNTQQSNFGQSVIYHRACVLFRYSFVEHAALVLGIYIYLYLRVENSARSWENIPSFSADDLLRHKRRQTR